MEFDWSLKKETLGLPADNLNRSKYATYLTSLIKTKAGDKYNLSNYVLNLDAEWGAGKTYFLKRWGEDLKGHHPVVYIDAWAIDYLDSPLMTVLSEIIDQLKSQTSKANTPEAKGKIKEIFKAAAPRVGSALMKRYLGFDFNVFDSDGNDQKQDKEIDFSKAGEKVLEVFCKEVAESKKSVEILKGAINEWVHFVIEKPVGGKNNIQTNYPAFIFIDELDRCKPTYAVEMLEAIKHVFDIPGLVFIVATNSAQLAHTVRAVYGSEFNAEIYLSRFFDNKFFLRAKVSKELLMNYQDRDPLNFEYLKKKGIILFPFVDFNKDKFFRFSSDLFNALSIPPRQALKVLNRVELAIVSFKEDSTLDIALLLCLCCFMEIGQKDLERLIDALNSAQTGDNFNIKNLAKVKLDLVIDILKSRESYNHISSELMKYEDLNGTLIGGDTNVTISISLYDYLLKYKRSTTLPNYVDTKAYTEIVNLIDNVQRSGIIDKKSRENHTKWLNEKRFIHLFYIFENSADFNSYQELVEMSSNLD